MAAEEKHPLDAYDLRHLVEHLLAAGHAADIHRLLACETPDEVTGTGSPKNSWFAAKQAGGEDQSYGADVEIAWRLADEAFLRELADASGPAIGLQTRYALIIASLSSAASRLSPQLLAELVEKNVWSLSRALTEALRLRPEARRADAVSALARAAGVEASDELLRAILQLADEEVRASALVAVSEHLPAALAPSVLEASRRFSQPQLQALTLTATAAHLPDVCLPEALQCTLELDDEQARAAVIGAIAPRLTATLAETAAEAARGITSETHRLEVLAAVGGRLSTRGATRADQIVRRTTPSTERARAAAAVSTSLPPASREKTLRREREAIDSIVSPEAKALALASFGDAKSAVGVAKRIRNERQRSQVMAAVADQLSESGVKEALAMIARARNQNERVELLARLAPHLPASSMLTALKLAATARNPETKAAGLQALAPFLPEDRVARAAREALTIKDVHIRAATLASLAPRLTGPVVLRALRAANRSRAPGGRAAMLRAIAPAVRTDEELAYAQRLADRLDAAERADVLAALTTEPTSEELSELTEAAMSLDDGDELGSLLTRLVETMRRNDVEACEAETDDESLTRKELLQRVEEAVRAREVDLRDEDLFEALAVMEGPDRRTVLHLALALAESQQQGGPTVADVVPYLAEYGRIGEALIAAREVPEKYARAQALARLVGFLEDDIRRDVVAECFRLTRAAVRSGAAEPWDAGLDVLESLLPYLDSRGIDRAIKTIEEAESTQPRGLERDRVAVVCCGMRTRLAACLVDRRSERVLVDALRSTASMRGVSSRADALRMLAPLLDAALVHQAVQLARGLEAEPFRSGALAALAERAADLDLERDAVELASEIAANAGDTDDPNARAEALGHLALPLQRLHPDDIGPLWCQRAGTGLLRRIARFSRRDLLTDLTQLVPAIHRLGGPDADQELARSARDVSRWWP